MRSLICTGFRCALELVVLLAVACSSSDGSSSGSACVAGTYVAKKADPQTVKSYCNDLSEHCMSYAVRCGRTTPDDCWPQLHANVFYFDCYSNAVSLSDCADQCLKDIDSASCTSSFPSNCVDTYATQ